MTAKLKLVQPSIEDELRQMLADRARYVAQLKSVDFMIGLAARALADQRGVAFIRVEQLQQEFGPQYRGEM